MRVQWTAGGFQVIDAAKNTVSVETTAWGGGDTPPSAAEALADQETGPDDPELSVAGTASALGFPPVHLVAVSLDGAGQASFGSGSDVLELGPEPYLLRVDANVRVFVRLDGPATLRRDGADGVRVAFPERRPVSMGFESRVGVPDERVTVTRTPEGVATGLSALAVGPDTTSPDRTWPTLREQPPYVEFGETTHVPRSISERRPDTGIELVVPPDLTYLTTGASLAHYLGATVRTAPDVEPHLELDGRVVRLGRGRAFQAETAALLRRTFYLDCLARTAGPHGGDLSVSVVADELGLDTQALYEAPLAERVDRYLDLPYESVADAFPEWHLTMHVAPTYETVRTLPHLIANVPHLFSPESEPLPKKEWLRLTVADGYDVDRENVWHADHGFGGEGASTTGSDVEPTPAPTDEPAPTEHPRADGTDETLRVTREISNVDLVKPTLGPGRSHGWLAEKVPIDVFKSLPAAYENRQKYLDDPGSELSVVAVVNDDRRGGFDLSDVDEADMRDETTEISTHYERRAEDLNIDLTVKENVSTAELARTFERRNDLVHFIGHRDERGLECANGFFSAETIRESNAQTFFLNACGSFPEGRTLVEKGSVGGGVTFESVTNDDAVKVGVAFARLIMNGFCIERALDYTRGQLMTPKDYAVVGDGTHVLTQNDSIVPEALFLSENDGGGYSMLIEQSSPWITGGNVQNSVADSSDSYHLFGTDRKYELNEEKIQEYLQSHDGPIIYNKKLYWSEDVKEIV